MDHTIDTIRIRSTDVPDDISLIAVNRKLDTHLEEYHERKEEMEARYRQQQEDHKCVMHAISDLTCVVKEQVDATRGVVEVYVTTKNVQRFVKWLSGFAFLAGMLGWLATKLPSLFTGG